MSKAISTVNVIEYIEDSVQSVRSYEDNESGNVEAENIFKIIVKENDSEITNEELEVIIEDGYYEQGNYQLFLVHSEAEEKIEEKIEIDDAGFEVEQKD